MPSTCLTPPPATHVGPLFAGGDTIFPLQMRTLKLRAKSEAELELGLFVRAAFPRGSS